ALDHITDLFITFDSTWRFSYINDAGLKLLGESLDEVLGQVVWERFPALRATELEIQYLRCMELRIPTVFDHLSHITGSALRIRAFTSPDGGLVFSATDITERRRAEQQLRLKQEHLLLTQKAAKIGSWELDLQDEELTISAEFGEIIGLPSYVSRLRYSDFLNSLFVSTDREAAQAALQKAIHGGKDFAVELHLRRPDGAVRLVSNRGKGFYNQGTPTVLGVLVDITPSDENQFDRFETPEPAQPARKPTRKKRRPVTAS